MVSASPKPFRVCLFGVIPGVGNLGVRALTTSLVHQILEIEPGAEISLMFGNRAGGESETVFGDRRVRIKIVNFRLSPRSRLRDHLFWILAMAMVFRALPIGPLRRLIRRRVPWIKALLDADWIGDVRGGDSFSDIYGLKRLAIGSIPNLIAKLLGKSYVLLPQTYGPFDTRAGRAIARGVIGRAARLFARDAHSLRVARCFLGMHARERRPIGCPDVAFTLATRQPETMRIEPALPKETGGVLIGLNVSGLLMMGGYSRDNMFGLKSSYPRMIDRLCRGLLARPETHLLLIPHVTGEAPEADTAACRLVWEDLRWRGYGDRAHLLSSTHDECETKAIIGRCDVLIGARMHACIAALSQGVPAIGVAYSRKFRGAFAMVGVGELALEARRLEIDAFVRRCLELVDRRREFAQRLALRMPRVKETVRACMRQALLGESRIDAAGTAGGDEKRRMSVSPPARRQLSAHRQAGSPLSHPNA
jgi:polysaccharide pyruvyl transferase WcaK-like protein